MSPATPCFLFPRIVYHASTGRCSYPSRSAWPDTSKHSLACVGRAPTSRMCMLSSTKQALTLSHRSRTCHLPSWDPHHVPLGQTPYPDHPHAPSPQPSTTSRHVATDRDIYATHSRFPTTRSMTDFPLIACRTWCFRLRDLQPQPPPL